MKNFKELLVWQKSHPLVLEVYKLTSKFPKDERYGLTSQMRGAAASISVNIAEGAGRKGQLEFARFCKLRLDQLAN